MTDPGQPKTYDIVVVGAGMAGTAAALAATRRGARVALLEKQQEPGGSAALSVGMFWTAPSVEAYRRRIPRGDIRLARKVVADHHDALEEIRAMGVRVAKTATRDIMTFGIGWSIDVRDLLRRARDEVVAAGGTIITGATATELLRDDTRAVTGVLVREASGILVRYETSSTVLATGGFQGAPEMLERYIGHHADRLVLRSSPGSVGDGLRLAASVGAAATAGMSSYYGHLLPYPMENFGPSEFTPMTQYYSEATLLVNVRGERFCDETLGDEILNQAVTRQPEARGVMLFDHHVRSTRAIEESFPGLGAIDRFELARGAGARSADAGNLDVLTRIVASWGVDGDVLARTVQRYTAVARAGGGMADGVPVSPAARPPVDPPFFALMVQPSVTFTLGGVRIDTDARALDHDGRPVPGLYIAGADIGGLSNEGYAGGLAPAYITGRWAGMAPSS